MVLVVECTANIKVQLISWLTAFQHYVGKCATTSGDLIVILHFAFLIFTCVFLLSQQILQLPLR